MSNKGNKSEWEQDTTDESQKEYFMEIDRMVNEGLGGGNVTLNNGLIDETTLEVTHDLESNEEGHSQP